MTCRSSLTGLPFGSRSWLPLYVNPASVSVFFAAAGLYVDNCFASVLTDSSVTHCGNRLLSPRASVGGPYPYSPSFETELRSMARLTAFRNAGMLYGYCVSSNRIDVGYPVVA